MTTAHCCSPMKQGIFLRVLFSGLFLSFLLRNTWLWHRFTTDQKKSNIQLPTSNNQQPTLFWIPNTRNLVFISIHCYMVTYTILDYYLFNFLLLMLLSNVFVRFCYVYWLYFLFFCKIIPINENFVLWGLSRASPSVIWKRKFVS